MEAEIDFILTTAAKYLDLEPTREDVRSVFAGIRPLLKSAVPSTTSSLSRRHGLFVEDAGLVTITGGKWTTYRQMAEDAVTAAANYAGLPERRCVTADLPIASREHTGPADCSADDVVRAVRNEMARTVEDVLARRSRLLFLDARRAMELARPVAEAIANELDRDKSWVEDQVREFRMVAEGYLPR